MMRTLERYQKCSYGGLEASQPGYETQSNYQEYLKLKARVEVLQRSQRNLLGEDLGPLNTKELEQLELQLETSLKQIRLTMTQFMLDQLADLQNKERLLIETNKALKRKLEEGSGQVPLRLAWEGGGHTIPYSRLPAHSDGFFQPKGGNSTLQIGYNPEGADEDNVSQTHDLNGFIPGFML
ncbi:hypothetical protein P3X46_023158 [Hevea brasiliensis]|uniref:K-box domain-containing protein n=2 Tax=Hevea brasiliensis TaxID=3981 RepID=A0ABQ9LA63_HEVBR|nr:hypothetical protein P3X46_023158 [Hevea brasiliensis]